MRTYQSNQQINESKIRLEQDLENQEVTHYSNKNNHVREYLKQTEQGDYNQNEVKQDVIQDSQKLQDEKYCNTDHTVIPRSDWQEEIKPIEFHPNQKQDHERQLDEKRKICNHFVHHDGRKSENLLNQRKLEKAIHHSHGKISKQDTPQNTQVQKQSEKTNQKESKDIIEKETHTKTHFTKIDSNNNDKLKLSEKKTVNQKIKTQNPKSIEKEWNKYVQMGKPVPEEFQKKVFQQYDSGLLKNAGLVQKNGKWFLETTWETAPIVKSYIGTPHIQKSLAFQLWAEFRTEKPLHYVRGKLNKNSLYYSIELKKSVNLPHELSGKTVYVRNTKNFFMHADVRLFF